MRRYVVTAGLWFGAVMLASLGFAVVSANLGRANGEIEMTIGMAMLLTGAAIYWHRLRVI